MGRNTKKIMVIDTETVGGVSYPIAYDVGGLIMDRSGKIYAEFHFVIKEIFGDLELMHTAYYSNKFRHYIEGIYKQEIEPLPFGEVLTRIQSLIDIYDVKTVAAYNLNFDQRAMSNTCDLLFDNRNWLNRDVEMLCIMGAACDVLYGKRYIKLARAHEWLTATGKIKTSAECGYRYVSGDYDFEEAHRGLDDCRIEAQILTAIFKTHRKFNGKPRGGAPHQVYRREKVRG